MTISASWRHRLRVLESSAAKNVRRRPRDLAGLSLAELIDEYENAVREFNAATAEIPVERDQADDFQHGAVGLTGAAEGAPRRDQRGRPATDQRDHYPEPARDGRYVGWLGR